MVGRGFLKPCLDKLRTDTPKALRRLLLECLRLVLYNRNCCVDYYSGLALLALQTVTNWISPQG